MFLPTNNEDAILVLKKVSVQISRKSSMDSGIGLQDDDQKKKSVTKMASTDKGEQKKLADELCKRLTFIAEKMAALSKESEDIQQKQRTSNEFQIQVMKKSDAPDLEKGVTKVLDMVEFDRKTELSRLLKKVDDFKRRLQRGTKLDGDDDELRDLMVATGDLEKKTLKGFDEIARLQVNTKHKKFFLSKPLYSCHFSLCSLYPGKDRECGDQTEGRGGGPAKEEGGHCHEQRDHEDPDQRREGN